MSRPTAIPPTHPLAPLIEAAGGVGALAKALGVGTASIYRWGTGGATPIPAIARGVNAWARRRKLPEPWPDAA